jgi:formate hydrogenlyase subunit 3/multisubunit Na+/H+ antiporter MnhD subunit
VSLPLLLFLATGALAATAALLRGRPSLSSSISASGTLLLAALVLYAPLDEPLSLLGLPLKLEGQWQVLGRSFVLDAHSRLPLSYLYLVGGFLFAGGWLARPGRYFYAVGLSMLGLLAAAGSIDPFLFAAVFLELAAMAAVVILASSRMADERGSLQLLVLYSLAMLVTLFTGWLLENAGITSLAPELAGRALLLLGLGFSILMLVPPFHFWLPTTASGAQPYALALVALALQSSGLFLLLRFMDTYAWLRDLPAAYAFLRAAGATMLVFGGLAALAQRRLTSMLAYGLLSDFGISLMAIGLGTPAGFQLALGMSAARVVSLAVGALGASVLAREGGSLDRQTTAGAARRQPLAAACAVLGVMGLGGFPLTPGFPGRWALLTQAAGVGLPVGAAILLGTVLVSAAALSWGRTFLLGPAASDSPRLRRNERLFLSSALLLSSFLGLFPQLSFPWVVAALAGLTNLVP